MTSSCETIMHSQHAEVHRILGQTESDRQLAILNEALQTYLRGIKNNRELGNAALLWDRRDKTWTNFDLCCWVYSYSLSLPHSRSRGNTLKYLLIMPKDVWICEISLFSSNFKLLVRRPQHVCPISLNILKKT